MMTVEELVDQLNAGGANLTQNGDKWRGECPGCGGRDRLVVTDDYNGNGSVRCFGRCPPREILAAVNLTTQDLYGNRRAGGGDVDELRDLLFPGAPFFDKGIVTPRSPLEGGAGILYRGESNIFFSDRGQGKTTVALMLAAAVAVNGKRVYIWDRENSERRATELFNSILEDHHDWEDPREEGRIQYAPYPRMSDEFAPEVYRELFEPYDLLIFDSMREAIAQLGGNPNADEDIAILFNLIVTPALQSGGCVVLLDNTGHEAKHRPKGAGGKLDTAQQAFKVKTDERFNPAQRGRIEIRCTRSRPGDEGEVWTMRVGGGTWELPKPVQETPTQLAARHENEKFREFEKAVIAALEEDQPQGWKSLADAVRERGASGRNATLRGWLDRLVEDAGSPIRHREDDSRHGSGYYLDDTDTEPESGGPQPDPSAGTTEPPGDHLKRRHRAKFWWSPFGGPGRVPLEPPRPGQFRRF